MPCSRRIIRIKNERYFYTIHTSHLLVIFLFHCYVVIVAFAQGLIQLECPMPMPIAQWHQYIQFAYYLNVHSNEISQTFLLGKHCFKCNVPIGLGCVQALAITEKPMRCWICLYVFIFLVFSSSSAWLSLCKICVNDFFQWIQCTFSVSKFSFSTLLCRETAICTKFWY